MRRRRSRSGLLALFALFAAGAIGCEAVNGAGGRSGAGAVVAEPRAPISDSAFAALVAGLSEPGGYFDTDNLISNETSYLQVVGALRERGVRGGAYIGVGPGQNFSYIAAIEPELAFVVDIRRDNMLQHLWFKALFEASESRLDYLCLMVARRCGGASEGMEVEGVVARVDGAEAVPGADSLFDRVLARAADFAVPLAAGDRETIRSIHARFAADGLDLRFNTHGRAPLPEYPTLRRLVLERDEDGRRASYLADEASYRRMRSLQRENRVIPVVGDLAGGHAVRAIGAEARGRGLTLSAFYTSNVEQYLFRAGSFPRFMDNLPSLPVDDGSVIIRSHFDRFRRLRPPAPGYVSTQLLDAVPALLARWEEGRIPSYGALVRSGAGP